MGSSAATGREAIFHDYADRARFLSTPGEACRRRICALAWRKSSSDSGNLQPSKVARFDPSDFSLDGYADGKDAAEVVGCEFDDCNPATEEVLLITDILVGSDEQIELDFGLPEQIAVLDSSPALFLRSSAIMAGKKPAHRPRHALVQQDLHAAAASSADSERSRTWQAISRVTEGKHSMNSSRL